VSPQANGYVAAEIEANSNFEIELRGANLEDDDDRPLSRWTSVSARRAWKQAERQADEFVQQSRGWDDAGPGEVSVEPQEAGDSTEAASPSNTTVVLVGATVAGAFVPPVTGPIAEFANVRLGRAARLFRKFGNKPK
jgi:hypothetical protein